MKVIRTAVCVCLLSFFLTLEAQVPSVSLWEENLEELAEEADAST